MLAEEAAVEFGVVGETEPPAELPLPRSTAELAHKAKWIGVIDGWVAQIKGDIQRELENGNAVEGWKLVRGKAKRRLQSPDACGSELIEAGIPNEQLWTEPKMKTPAQLEKLGVGKEQRREVKVIVKKYAFTPDGALTIAPTWDPRDPASALEDAKSEFADEPTGDDDDFS
jgi:hypothetical protein